MPKLAVQCLSFLCVNVAPYVSYLTEGKDVAYLYRYGSIYAVSVTPSDE